MNLPLNYPCIIAAALAAAIAVAACATTDGRNDIIRLDDKLGGVDWELASVAPPDDTLSRGDFARTDTLKFSSIPHTQFVERDDWALGGGAPCNEYGGGYRILELGRIRIDEISTTLKGCDEHTMEHKALFYNALRDTTEYDVGTQSLRLTAEEIKQTFEAP